MTTDEQLEWIRDTFARLDKLTRAAGDDGEWYITPTNEFEDLRKAIMEGAQ